MRCILALSRKSPDPFYADSGDSVLDIMRKAKRQSATGGSRT